MRHPKPTIAAAILACSLALALAACGGGGGDDPGGGSGGTGGTGGTGGLGGTGGDGGSGGTGGDGGTGGEGGTGGCGTLPSISALEPDHGAVGNPVWVVGCNFHPQPNKNEIWFNGTKSAVFQVSEDLTRLKTAVPSGATSGTIRILVDGVRVDGPVFTIDVIDPTPAITGILPAGTTEARPGFDKSVVVTIQGTGFIPQSHVYMSGLSGGERFLETECRYSSATSMQCTLTKDFVLAPQVLKFKVVNEREGIPGGGTSAWINFYVVSHIDLLSAYALSEKHVGLVFSRAVGEFSPGHFGFSGGLEVRQASRPSPTVVLVELSNAMQRNVTYSVQLRESFSSDQGGEIWNRASNFRGFNSLPQPLGAFGADGGGCGATAFQGPGAISAADGQVFVTELAGQQVQVLNPDGTSVGFLGYDGLTSGLHAGDATAQGCPTGGSSATGAFRNPRGKVAVDPISGDRIVADTGNGRVLRFAEAGDYKGEFGAAHTQPVIAAQLGSQVMVADTNDRVRVMTTSGSTVTSFGGPGTGDGQFSFAIAGGGTPAIVADNVYVYVSEPGNHRVQKFKASDMSPYGWVGVNHVSFQIQGECCSPGTGQAEFTNIKGLAMDVAGYLYVADEASGGRIQKLTSDGQHVMTVLLNFLPGAIEIDDENNLWISDVTSNTVKKYRL